MPDQTDQDRRRFARMAIEAAQVSFDLAEDNLTKKRNEYIDICIAIAEKEES